jgi:DNA-binding LytR/AlgR family response regulator
LLFLDIELYKISGLVVGEKIRKEYNLESMHIVFISGKTKYHHEVFKIRPLDFIDKPIDKKEVIECISYAMKLDGKTTGTFTLKYNRKIYKIPVENIIYIESLNKILHIHCIDGVRKMYGTLKEVAKELSKYNFVQTHRSYLVNIEMVEIFKSDCLIMADGTSIPISRTQKYKIHDIQNQLQGRI